MAGERYTGHPAALEEAEAADLLGGKGLLMVYLPEAPRTNVLYVD